MDAVRGKNESAASHCINKNIEFGHIVYIFTAVSGGRLRCREAEGLQNHIAIDENPVPGGITHTSSRRTACACVEV